MQQRPNERNQVAHGGTILQRFDVHRPERNRYCRFQRHGISILSRRAEVPARESGAGKAVEAVIGAAQHSYVADAPVTVDDRIQRDGSFYPGTH